MSKRHPPLNRSTERLSELTPTIHDEVPSPHFREDMFLEEENNDRMLMVRFIGIN